MSEDRPKLDASEEAVLVARLTALSRELPPARDLWPAIEARISLQRAPARFAFARAASFALPLLGALAIGALLGNEYAVRRAPAPTPAAPVMELEHMETAFSSARENYLRRIAQGHDRLQATDHAALRAQLEEIDRAVHELRAAMAADPGNPLYLDALQMTREREMEMLADLSTATMTRL